MPTENNVTDSNTSPTLETLLAALRAQHWLYYTLHWQALGEPTYARHLLFQRLYETLPEQFDTLAEKLVSRFGTDAVNGVGQMAAAIKLLSGWISADPIATALASETELRGTIAALLGKTPDEAIAMDNFLRSLDDEHDQNVALLGKAASISSSNGEAMRRLCAEFPQRQRLDPATESRWKKVILLHALLAGEGLASGGRKIGVDREARCIRGMILAQEGPFKSEGRGEFDQDAIHTVRDLAAKAPNGLKSRFTHPDLSNDGLGKLLGRVRDPWLDTITVRESEGQVKSNPVLCCRGDLYLDESAFKTPNGGASLGEYLLTLVESDPNAVSTSLVLETDYEHRTDPRTGRPLLDADGAELPPLWRPLALHASDVVDTGDAVDGILSAQLSTDGLPDAVVRQASILMDRQFAGKPRDFISSRCTAWLTRFLNRKFGSADPDGPTNPPAPEGHTPDHGPAGEEFPDNPKPDEPLHNGCRSTLAFHHITLCRLCGGTIQSCGCDHRDKESRVITMAKEPCAACLAQEGPHGSGDDPKSPPDDFSGNRDTQPGSEAYNAARDPERLRRKMRIEAITHHFEAENE